MMDPLFALSHLHMPALRAWSAVWSGTIHHDSLTPAESKATEEKLANLLLPVRCSWLVNLALFGLLSHCYSYRGTHRKSE